MSQSDLKPFSRWEKLWLPIAYRLLKGKAFERLNKRYRYTKRLELKQKLEAKLKKELRDEALNMADLLVNRWDHLGYNHEYSSGSKKNIHKVEFERIKVNDQILYYKVLTRVRAPFGAGMSPTLPYRVNVSDLIDDQTLRELSWTTQRVVTAVYEDPRKGVWIRVHRQDSVGGLPSIVRFAAMLEYWPADSSNAPILIGIGDHKQSHVVNLADNPHVLVGGATKSGKSNMLNCIISGLMRFTDPHDLKMVLIDLKKTEFKLYKGAPHLHKPVISDAEDALTALEEMRAEIRRRADLMEDSPAKELSEWNEMHPDQTMPRFVTVIDEFAELVGRTIGDGKDIRQRALDLVFSICNLGRAVGIHLIVATQRPATNIVPNDIKINMSLVIGGRVQNRDQSRVILSHAGLEQLPKVPGRMIYQEGSDEYKIQTPYISTQDIRECIRIAHGKQAGVIALDGADPVIVPDGLTHYLIAECEGSLAMGLVQSKLYQFAINQEMFKAYKEDLLKAGRVQLGPKVYDVRKVGHTERIQLVAEVLPVEEAAAPDPEPSLSLVVVPERTPEQQAALDTIRQIRKSKEGTRSA